MFRGFFGGGVRKKDVLPGIRLALRTACSCAWHAACSCAWHAACFLCRILAGGVRRAVAWLAFGFLLYMLRVFLG